MNDLLKSEKVDLALKSNNFIFYSRQISYVPSFDILASHQIDVDQSETRREGQSSQFLIINSYADYSDNFTFAGIQSHMNIVKVSLTSFVNMKQ